MVKSKPFDAAEYLNDPQVIAYYLADAFESGDSRVILAAIQDVARAGKMSKIARATGLSRTSLYWDDKTAPGFATVLAVLKTLRVQLVPVMERKPAKPRAPTGVVIAGGNLAASGHRIHAQGASVKARKKK